MDLDSTLAALAADPEEPVDVAEVALHLARDEYPDLDAAIYLARLDAYAEAVAPRLVGSLEARTAALAHFLFEEEGFSGNDEDYYDPRNSYLSEVLDRRKGLPITLAVVAAAIGERAGLTVQGIALPGHFVARAVEGDDAVLFDPFHGGQFLDGPAAEKLVEAVTGQPFTLAARHLLPAAPGAVVARMLMNLKGTYLKGRDFRRAARIIGRLVQLGPDDALQRRDYGVTLAHSGEAGKALGHLQFYLAQRPGADDLDAVRDILKQVRAELAKWN